MIVRHVEELPLYGDPTNLPPVGRRPERPRDPDRTPLGTSKSLSQPLGRSLHQGLYSGLFPGAPARAHEVAAGQAPGESSTPVYTAAPRAAETSFGRTIRRVELLSGESVSHTFTPEEGVVATPPEAGRMLVLTNRRVIAFGQKEGMRQTVIMPVEEVKAVAVNVGHRSKGTLFQGGLMVVAAVFFYVLLAYWLTGRLDGPTVPIIRMDLVAFVVFLAVLTGVAMLAQIYFAKPDGEATFQGDGVKLSFPFRGDTAEADMYRLVNTAFAARQTAVGDSSVIAK